MGSAILFTTTAVLFATIRMHECKKYSSLRILSGGTELCLGKEWVIGFRLVAETAVLNSHRGFGRDSTVDSHRGFSQGVPTAGILTGVSGTEMHKLSE